MKKAQVSISLSGASTVATDTAGIILMDGTLSQLVPLFNIGQAFKSTVERGIVMSTLPGIVCIGAIFFLHWGIVPAMLFYQRGLRQQYRQFDVATACPPGKEDQK